MSAEYSCNICGGPAALPGSEYDIREIRTVDDIPFVCIARGPRAIDGGTCHTNMRRVMLIHAHGSGISHPILFSAPMVNAILAGRKKQTRRAIKPQPHQVGTDLWTWPGAAQHSISQVSEHRLRFNLISRCPYGRIADDLWVRETWATAKCCDSEQPANIETPHGYGWPVWYSADGACAIRNGFDFDGGPGFATQGRKRPAIHMPRWASRITLRIVDIRVERLQEITAVDAMAEGLEFKCEPGGARTIYKDYLFPNCWHVDPVQSFASLWDSINKNIPGHTWADNPWVHAITFRKV